PEMSGSKLRKLGMKLANTFFAQSAEKGALPMLYAATSNNVEGGDYIGPGGLMNARGYPEKQESSEASYDEETAERLWEVSEEMTNVEFDIEKELTEADD
ncbi:MAG: short-chain dehydrogenase, partial [Halobacteria archaeon]|nr:short-chain dehydrogenase [Halobacteria archaeon]